MLLKPKLIIGRDKKITFNRVNRYFGCCSDCKYNGNYIFEDCRYVITDIKDKSGDGNIRLFDFCSMHSNPLHVLGKLRKLTEHHNYNYVAKEETTV